MRHFPRLSVESVDPAGARLVVLVWLHRSDVVGALFAVLSPFSTVAHRIVIAVGCGLACLAGLPRWLDRPETSFPLLVTLAGADGHLTASSARGHGFVFHSH